MQRYTYLGTLETLKFFVCRFRLHFVYILFYFCHWNLNFIIRLLITAWTRSSLLLTFFWVCFIFHDRFVLDRYWLVISWNLILLFVQFFIVSDDIIFMLFFVLYSFFGLCFTPHFTYNTWKFTKRSFLSYRCFYFLFLNILQFFFKIIIITWKRTFSLRLFQNTLWWQSLNFTFFCFTNFIRRTGIYRGWIILSLFSFFSFFRFLLSLNYTFNFVSVSSCSRRSGSRLSRIMDIRRFSIFGTHLIGTAVRFFIYFQNQFINDIV